MTTRSTYNNRGEKVRVTIPKDDGAGGDADMARAANRAKKFGTSFEQDWARKAAERNALEWIDGLIAAHESGIRELKMQRERFVTICIDPSINMKPVHVLGWVVNDVQNVQRNLRLDLVGNLCADLAKAG